MSIIDPEIAGEIMGIKYNENHKWKYLYGITPDEIVLLKWRVYNLQVFYFV